MAFMDKFLNLVAEEITPGVGEHVDTLTLDVCKVKAYEMRKEYPQIAGFFIKVNSAGQQSGNIRVTVSYLDGDMQPITLDGVHALSSVYQAHAMDKKIIELLNGNPDAICKL